MILFGTFFFYLYVYYIYVKNQVLKSSKNINTSGSSSRILRYKQKKYTFDLCIIDSRKITNR